MRSYVVFRRYWDAFSEVESTNPMNAFAVRLALRLATDEAYELGLHQQKQSAPKCIWTIRDGKWASSTCENVETLTADQLPRQIYVGVTHCVGCGEIIGKVVWSDDVDPEAVPA